MQRRKNEQRSCYVVLFFCVFHCFSVLFVFVPCCSFCRYRSFFVVSVVFCGGVLFSVVVSFFPCCLLFV